MNVIISLIVGFIFGVMTMCLLQADRVRAYLSIIKMLIDELETDLAYAIEEKKTSEFIDGMKRVIDLVKYYFEEENSR